MSRTCAAPGAGRRDHHQRAEPQRRVDGDDRGDVVAGQHERLRRPRRRPRARSAATAPSTAASSSRVGQRATPLDDAPPGPGRGAPRRARGRPDRCASARRRGTAPRAPPRAPRRAPVRSWLLCTSTPPFAIAAPDRERRPRIRRGMLRSPARGGDPAVPGDRVGAGRAGRRAVGRPRAPRRRPRPVAHRAPAARRRRRRSPPTSRRAASAPAPIVSWQLPTTLETMVVMVALARLGAVQNPLIPILREREVGFITRQVGTEVMITDGALARVRPRRARARPRRRAGLRGDHHRPRHRPRVDRQHAPTRRRVIRRRSLRRPRTDESTDAVDLHVVGHDRRPEGRPPHRPVGDARRHRARSRPWARRPTTSTPSPSRSRTSAGSPMLTASLMTGMRLVALRGVRSRDHARAHGRAGRDPARERGAVLPRVLRRAAAPRRHAAVPAAAGARWAAARRRRPRSTAWRARSSGVHGIASSWGLTEFPVATFPSPDAPLDVLDHTTGPPVAGVSVRAVAGDERVCATGEEGELRLRGPQCFLGYVDASLDAAAFDADGWFRTGDLGIIDADGNVSVTGRIKDIIIRNAENISALEIEEALYQHPAVVDVAVVAAPDRAPASACARSWCRRPMRRRSRSPTSRTTAGASASRCRSAPSSSSWSTRCPATRSARCSSRT